MKASLIIKTAKSETRVDNVDFMFDCASCEMNVKGKTIVIEYDQEVADEVRKNNIATVSISNKETNGKAYASVYGTTILIAKLIK